MVGNIDYNKQFIIIFHQLCGRFSEWDVWSDFIDSITYTIAQSTEYRVSVMEKRKELYGNITQKYKPKEFELFSKLFILLVDALESNTRQDFLGDIYMELKLNSKQHGQFFTPWHIAELMAKIQAIDSDFNQRIKEQGYISIIDPSCGSGRMLLAFAGVLKDDCNIEYQTTTIFVGQDIDPIVAKMCFIQLSLIGCMGYVVIGNSITNPIGGSLFYPEYDIPENILFTPMWWINGANLLQYKKPIEQAPVEIIQEPNIPDKLQQVNNIENPYHLKPKEKFDVKKFFGVGRERKR